LPSLRGGEDPRILIIFLNGGQGGKHLRLRGRGKNGKDGVNFGGKQVRKKTSDSFIGHGEKKKPFSPYLSMRGGKRKIFHPLTVLIEKKGGESGMGEEQNHKGGKN